MMLVDSEVKHESAAYGKWWETKLSAVDWSVPAALQLRRHRYWRKHLPIQPPHYHDLLLRPSFPSRGRYGAVATKTTPPACPVRSVVAIQSVSVVNHGNDPISAVEDAENAISDRWNDGLIGVRMAEDALEQFEFDVGFHYSIMPDVMLEKFLASHLDASMEVSEQDLDTMRSLWLECLYDLVGEYVVPERPTFKLDEDFRPKSSLSSSEYDSEHSAESEPFPCTPTQKHNIEVRIQQSPPATGPRELPQHVTVSAHTPTPTSTSPVHAPKQPAGRSRSGSSLPSGSSSRAASTSSRSPSPPDFVFPAINANYQYLPPNLRKDDQGFYTPVTPPGSPHRIRKEHALGPSGLSKSTSAVSLLPPFLGENQMHNSRKASKTRAIVDQLRSGGSEKKKAHTRARGSSSAAAKDAASHRNSPGGSSEGSGVCANAGVSSELSTITSPPKEHTASNSGRRDSSVSVSNARSSSPKERGIQDNAGKGSNSGTNGGAVSLHSSWSNRSPSTSISSHPAGNNSSNSRFSSATTVHSPPHPANLPQPIVPHQPHLLSSSSFAAPPNVSLPAGSGQSPSAFFAPPPRLSRAGPGQARTAPPLLPVGYAVSMPHMPPPPPGMSPSASLSPQQQQQLQFHHMQSQMHQVHHQVPVLPQIQAGHGHGHRHGHSGGHWMPVVPMGPVGQLSMGGTFSALGTPPHITGSSGMQHVAW